MGFHGSARSLLQCLRGRCYETAAAPELFRVFNDNGLGEGFIRARGGGIIRRGGRYGWYEDIDFGGGGGGFVACRGM